MDFISNLIKRPISLVITETSTATDKSAISSSLPSTLSNAVDLEQDKDHQQQQESSYEQHNTDNHRPQPQQRPSSLCSSFNGNFTDFIGVPDEELLGEFDDFLPPPPPLLSASDLLSPVMDNNNLQSQTPSPPPPPLTPSMMASQTIDELLSEISDNLTLAGINDEVLAIASPPHKAELSPLASKASLNNSKSSIHTPRTPTNNHGGGHNAAAGSAATSPAVFEANSTLHKFHVDPELATGLFEDQQHQHQYSANDLENTSGVNKSSNKFVGLTEFDEAKIPELPGDLNPNIEEQYNVTFEECFIPTLTAKLGSKVPNELAVEKTHLLLPSEGDNTSMSSANDTFSDCQDGNAEERDPLANTFADQPTLNTTTGDGDCYQSAIQDEGKEDPLANATMDARELDNYKLQILDTLSATVDVAQLQDYEDEPMDVDMNVTMDVVIKSSAENIQNVEKVLEHAENILQHLGEKTPPVFNKEEPMEEVKIIGYLAKPTETSKMTFVINAANSPVDEHQPQHLEMEQSNHDVSLNKSIELPMNKAKTISSECVITAVNNEDMPPKEEGPVENPDIMKEYVITTVNNEDKPPKEEGPVEKPDITKESAASLDSKNLTINTMNTSTSSTSSCKSPNSRTGSKLNLTTCLSTSTSSLKTSAPNSPSFPIKQKLQGSSFPKSPKMRMDKPTFLEKSDYVVDLENKLNSQEYAPTAKNVNDTFVEPKPPSQGKNRLTFCEGTSSYPAYQSDKRLTFNVETPDIGHTENKRLTFNVQTMDPSTQLSEPHDTTETISKEKIDSRRTFNIPSEEHQSTPMDTSYAPMDVDENFSQNATLPMEDTLEPNSPLTIDQYTDQSQSQSQPPDTQQRSQSPALQNPNIQQRSLSPALPNMHENLTLTTALPLMHERSQSPDLSSMTMTMPKADSPPLPSMQEISNSPPLSAGVQERSNSPPLPTMQYRSDSPPLPTMQKRPQSPALPAMQQRLQTPPLSEEKIQMKEQSPPLSTSSSQHSIDLKRQEFLPTELSSNFSPPLSAIQKRQAIHGFGTDVLSAKEQSNNQIKDEKDVFVEKCSPSHLDDMFTTVTATSTTLTNTSGFSAFDQSSLASNSANSNNGEQQVSDDEFQGNNNLILNPSDFDYLLTKGNNNTPVDRSSLLLKFDPLLGVPVPVNQGQQPQQHQQQLHLQIPTNINNNPCLSPTIEEDEHNESTNRSFVVDNACRPSQGGGRGVAAGPALSSSAKLLKERSQEVKQQLQQQQHNHQIKRQLPQPGLKKNATMSVDVIKDMSLDNDCNKTFENSNSTQPDDKQINYKMDELEKKVKNEVLKTEDIEKKLKDAEQREEALIKRITEKDKTVTKMNGVIEAYEKAIAELIAEKEQLIQNYEKQLAEVKADRDSNYHHLTSLETTFSDLHVKYEKSKEMTCQLKGNEEGLIAESRKNAENLRLQEQRYDKMKNHAMQQLEIANKKLECLTREHAMETTKLKALLKKEEIARSSMSEQLAQKSKENAELVKICDELISGQGS